MSAYRQILVWSLRVAALLGVITGASSAWGTISYGFAMREPVSPNEVLLAFASTMTPFVVGALVLLTLAEILALSVRSSLRGAQ